MRVSFLVSSCLISVAMMAGCASQPESTAPAAPAMRTAEAAQPAPAVAPTPAVEPAPAATPAPASSAEAALAKDDLDTYTPPAGYRQRIDGGRIVYCAKVVVLGSRFPKDDCRTRDELEEMEVQKASMRGNMGQRQGQCSGPSCGGS